MLFVRIISVILNPISFQTRYSLFVLVLLPPIIEAGFDRLRSRLDLNIHLGAQVIIWLLVAVAFLKG